VVPGADVVFVVGPAFSTGPFSGACAPYLSEGQIVLVCPGSCGGALVFKQEAGLDIRSEDILVAETSTLPYAVRLVEPSRIKVFLKLKGGFFLAALPAGTTQAALGVAREVCPGLEAARNVLQTSLQNANPVIHPAVTLLNAALIERTGGDFFFYEQGVSQGVGSLIQAVDQERILIGKRLGLEIVPDPELGCRQGYMTEATYDVGYREAPGFKGIKAQDALDHRYLNEDVGYGLVFMADLGKQIGVPTPTMDALVTLASQVMNRDYRGEAKRTMASIGLAGLGAEALNELLD
jgi:opine dehydrogenase